MVPYKVEPTNGAQGKLKTQAKVPLAGMYSGKESLLRWMLSGFGL